MLSVRFVLIFWFVACALAGLEYAALKYMLPRKVHEVSREATAMYIQKHKVATVVNIANIAIIFTSCFLVKHDGLEILDLLAADACGG